MQASFYEPKYKEGKILAFADVDIGEGVIVRGFRVVDGAKGLFAAVPQKGVLVSGQTRYMNQVVFAKPELKERLLSDLLEAYRRWRDERDELKGRELLPSEGEGRSEASWRFTSA